jgi:hypothetical protein
VVALAVASKGMAEFLRELIALEFYFLNADKISIRRGYPV